MISAKRLMRRKDGRGFNPSQRRLLEARLKERKVLTLRLQGMSYVEIGERMGCTEAWAYQIMMRVLNRWDQDVREKVPQVRQIEVARCDKLLEFAWTRAKKGSDRHIQVCLKIAERRARLLGLDKPVDVRHTGTGEGGAIELEVFRRMVADAETPSELGRTLELPPMPVDGDGTGMQVREFCRAAEVVS